MQKGFRIDWVCVGVCQCLEQPRGFDRSCLNKCAKPDLESEPNCQGRSTFRRTF